MSKEQNSRKLGWFQYFIAPAVVGLIVLLGQSLVQPFVAEKTRAQTERWNAKREAFINAIALVDKEFGSREFTLGADALKEKVKLGDPPSNEDKRRCYRELLLYAENRESIEAFLRCLGARKDQKTVWHGDKITMLQLMREELGFGEIELREEDVRFFFEKAE